MSDLDKMKARALDIVDPNNPYTLEDFNKEFGSKTKLTSEIESFKIKFNFINISNNEHIIRYRKRVVFIISVVLVYLIWERLYR